MTFVGQCFGSISKCFYGTGDWKPSQSTVPIMPVIPDVILDTSCMGKYFLTYGSNSSIENICIDIHYKYSILLMYSLFRTRGRSGEKRISIMWYWCSKGINPNIAKQGILGSENTTVWNLELWGMIFCKDVQISLFNL